MSSRFPACVERKLAWLLVFVLAVLPAGPASAGPAAVPTPNEAEDAEEPASDFGEEADSAPEGTGQDADPRAADPVEVVAPGAQTRRNRGEGRGQRSAGSFPDGSDPLAPIESTLARLRDLGVEVEQLSRSRDELRGWTLEARIKTNSFDVVVYMLQQTSEQGFQIQLRITGPGSVHMTARTARDQAARGVLFVEMKDIDVSGLGKEQEARLQKLFGLGPEPGIVWASDLTTELEILGFQALLWPSADGTLSVHVEPGRLIRRVRVRGHIPLSKRELRRELSLSARPGALARGACVPRAELRDTPRPEVCRADDLPCQEWIASERERLRRYLFDEGYLQAKVEFGLSCGRAVDEADLWVFLDKGPPYRIPRRQIKVTGNVGSRDARWIRRVFRPTVSPFLPISSRVTRKHIEDAKEKVAREYAAAEKSGIGVGSRRELQYPYPGVRVETSYDDLTIDDPPSNPKLALEVDVQLGQGVKTSFLGNSVPEGRLLGQLQLFKRREPVTEAAAVREAENLRAYYQARGNLLATVRGRTPDFGKAGPRQLLFVIDEGPRTRIRRIELVHSPHVPRRVVADIERTYNKDAQLKRLGRFVEADVRKDLSVLLSAYRDAGYLCARPVVKVGFWPGSLDREGSHARLGLDTALGEPGEPQWIQSQFDAEGYRALRKERRLGIHARVEVDAGPRVLTSGDEIVRHLEEPIPTSGNVEGVPQAASGAWGAPRMLRNSVLRRKRDERPSGIPVRPGLARDAQAEIERAYHSSGYPVANAVVRWIYTDQHGQARGTNIEERLASEETGLCQEHAEDQVATVATELDVYEGKRGVFGHTMLRGNFKTRDWVLRNEIDWEPGETYDQRKVDRTLRHIDGTGVAEIATAQPRPVGCHLADGSDAECRVHETISMTEAKDYAVRPHFGLGGATLDPFYVFVRPIFPNMWGTAWDLTLEGHWGFNPPGLRDAVCGSEDCYERSARATLLRQRIWASPLTFSVSGSVQQRVTPARGQIDSALTEVRLSWPIDQHWQVYGSYLFQIANISRDLVKPSDAWNEGCGAAGTNVCTVVNRGEAIVPNRTGALQSGVSWQRVDNPFNPNSGFIATADFLVASPWLGGWDWWARGDLNWQHFVPIPGTNGRLSVRYNLRYGHAFPIRSWPGASTTSIPDVWRYYGGGTVDLGIRGIEPQTMLLDIEHIENQFGVVRLHPRAVGAHIRALGTVALQVISMRNLFGGNLAHSLFLDFGILTQRWSHVRFNRDFRRSIGINFIKWDISIVTLAVGYAVLIPNAIWAGNVGPTDDPNGRFVFNVGATF